MNIVGFCPYETPCGWCSKWDKKCDNKIGNKNVLTKCVDYEKENYALAEQVKQAQIDVLNKAKEQCKAIAKEWSDDGDVDGIFAACSCSQAIDDLIEEVGGINNDH